MSVTIIGWAADGGLWCNECAEDRYGKGIWIDDPDNRVQDHEGNDVHPIFSTDSEYGACDGCREVLE